MSVQNEHLELLAIDAEMALERYLDALKEARKRELEEKSKELVHEPG